MKGTCPLCGKVGPSRKGLRLMEAALDALIVPLALVGVVGERPDRPAETDALLAEGLGMARLLHQHAHGWIGGGQSLDLQQSGTNWTARAMKTVQTYQDERDGSVFKGNPRLMEMRTLVMSSIANDALGKSGTS